MSVLKCNRTESKVQYITTAIEIEGKTIHLLTRMSTKYQKLFAEKVMGLAIDLVSCCEEANKIYPSSERRIYMREELLLKAQSYLSALDVQLKFCYDILMMNSKYALESASGHPVEGGSAKEKLEKLAYTLGDLIDKEDNFIKKVIESDKRKLKNMTTE